MPGLIWSGLVGALIALVSSFLTNWGNNRRLRQQLDHDLAQRKAQLSHDEERQRIQLAHDSDEHRIGREMSLRRDVYLDAAEATGSLQEYISNSARTDLPETERLSLIKGSTGVLNKVHVVGSNETIKAFTGVQLAFARGVFNVEEQRLAILKTNFKIDALQRAANNVQPDAIAKEHDRLFALQLALAQKAAEANLAIQEAFVTAVVTLRAELGLAINVQDYEAFMADQRSLLRTDLLGFINRVRVEANSVQE
jgi:hypothetical protein